VDGAAAPTVTRVVLVRPWTDGRAGGGCCGGEVRDGVCRDGTHPVEELLADPVGQAWRAVRRELPDADVQVVDVANTAYLLPTTFRAVRRRSGERAGVLASLRAAARATTAGSVLVDGQWVGDVAELGPDGVLAAVRRARAAVNT